MFQPDPGHVWFDADLSGADARVVAWDANDEDLKAAFRAGLKIHKKNAADMFGTQYTRLAGGSPEEFLFLQKCKKAVHATNYLTSARNLAKAIGWTVADAQQFMDRWFSAHPAIKEWHKAKKGELEATGRISNKFGYSIAFYDRPDECLTKAVAWVPQSTVALTTLKGALAVEKWIADNDIRNYRGHPLDPFLLQVHDSLDFQLHYDDIKYLPEIGRNLHVTVPYDDPLVIPWDLKMSSFSWGKCQKCDWKGVPQ